MRILRHHNRVPRKLHGAAVAIGNFDGVHHGHRTVIGHAIEAARAAGRPAAVLTFEPHPRTFFAPEAPSFRLTSLHGKGRLFEEMGIDFMCALRFDQSMASLHAADFVREVLVDGLHAGHLVVGYDFVFGRGRGGDAALLEALGAQHGFEVSVVEPVRDGGEIVSSSAVREALKRGDPREAGQLLGRVWEIEGRVRKGDRRGRTLGYPTANLRLGDYVEPAFGIYAVRCGVERKGRMDWHDAVASLGLRPTFGGREVLLEVHLFGLDEELYGRRLRVELIDFIRPERKYDDVEALKRQMADDCTEAKRILAAAQYDGLKTADPARGAKERVSS